MAMTGAGAVQEMTIDTAGSHPMVRIQVSRPEAC